MPVLPYTARGVRGRRRFGNAFPPTETRFTTSTEPGSKNGKADFDQRPPPQWEEDQWDQRPIADATVPQTLAELEIDQSAAEYEQQWHQRTPCWSDTPLGKWAIEANRWDGVDPIPPEDEPVFYAD